MSSVDSISKTFSEALKCLLEADEDRARQFLKQVEPEPIERLARTSVGDAITVATYRRDNFTCRYCGRETIFLPVLRLLSEFFADLVPYHPAWKYGECHPAYMTHSTSLDHVVPLARGGANSESNLVTACAQCNYTKSSWLLSELGWDLKAVISSNWDGLTGAYMQLAETSALPYHRKWLRILASPR